MDNSMHIRPIEPKDHDAILALNEASVAVLSPLNNDQMVKLIAQSCLHAVVEIEGVVAAFLLVVGPKTAYRSINYQWFDEQYDDFYYIDRVVVHAHYRAQKIGQTLYQYLIDQAYHNHVGLLCAEIDIAPPNEPSLHFHRKWGFKEVSTLTHSAAKSNEKSAEKIVSLQVCVIN